MILIKPAGFVGFLYHIFVGRESLDVRYCFVSKAWRDRRRLTSCHLDLSCGLCGKPVGIFRFCEIY